MDSRGEAAEVGTISQRPPIDVATIPSTTHLFFDDDNKHVTNVNDTVKRHNTDHPEAPIQLTSILCPTGDNIVLVKGDGTSETVRNVRQYSFSKNKIFSDGTFNFFDNNYTEHRDFGKKNVGSGFTSDVIDQIIAFETSNPGNQRLYFFDFDHLLSLAGVFVPPPVYLAPDDYAHFLFSDHVPKTDNPRDRINLLKQMFGLIGGKRVYVITCNPAASVKGPIRSKFIEILRVLLPDLIEDHVKLCNRRNVEGVVVQDKGHHILEFIKAYQPSSGGSIKRRRMTSKKINKTRYGRRSRKYTRNVRRNKYRK